MGKTFAEKVLAKKSGQAEVVPGQIVIVQPDHLLTHDNTAAIVGKIKDDLDEFGVARPAMPVIVLDHVIPAATEKHATNHKTARAFAEKFKLPNFYDVGAGVCHQVLMEKGHALPGSIIVGSDSHTCSYGAVGVFSTGVDRTEAAALYLKGETWLRVPDTIKITLTGKFVPGVSAKDLVLSIIGDIGADGAAYQAVEFHGDIQNLSVEDRFAISNMGVEMGAKIAAFPVDDITRAYLKSIGVQDNAYEPVWADPDAQYIRELTYDMGAIEPVIAAPHKVDNTKKIGELEGMAIDQCLLGTCTNGRLSDLEAAARILGGKKVASTVRLLVLPASKDIYEAAIENGTITALSKAGGVVLPPGCGPCLGAHQGALAPNEKCLSTANRNFKGRMGCKEAEIYLSSPETLAASAIYGKVTDPRKVVAK
ncbi:MAG: 3-isopropylmalate dehydratase large subunit [Myxococcota bacterium]|nr:3-isopropylmalate dehydratase large subunit [Myxococcota bacterium]